MAKQRVAAAAPPRPHAAIEESELRPDSALLDALVESTRVESRPPREGLAAITGHLCGLDEDGRVLFRPEGSERSFPVSICVEMAEGALVRAARQGRRALVLRSADPEPRWLMIGLVTERVSARARDAAPGHLELRVDGETVCMEAQRSIELSCGKSSLLLRADGRVVLSGVQVVTKSRGPVKIKGATIALN